MEHSDNGEKDKLTNDEGIRDENSNGNDDDMDDQDWWALRTFHYFDLILILFNLSLAFKHFKSEHYFTFS